MLRRSLPEVLQAWGEFDKFIEEKYYPPVNVGYAGTAIIRGSEIGGMYNDNVRGMPTFQTMYVTQQPLITHLGLDELDRPSVLITRRSSLSRPMSHPVRVRAGSGSEEDERRDRKPPADPPLRA